MDINVFRCSNLFEPNKQDFNIISRYIIADLIQLLTVNKHLPNGFMVSFDKLSKCKF